MLSDKDVDGGAGASGSGVELERLRGENRALNEQVKLLVRTEQQLYRSKTAMDRQMARISALASFSLGSSNVESLEGIVARGVDLLDSAFDLDSVAAISVSAEGPRVEVTYCGTDGERDGQVFTIADAEWAWLIALRGPVVVEIADDVASRTAVALLEGMRRSWTEHAGTAALLLPLRKTPGDSEHVEEFSLLLACKDVTSSRSYYKEAPEVSHLPYLQLVCAHLVRAMSNAVLTKDLRHSGEQVAEANARLSESLITLEQAQHELVQARKMEAVGRLAGGIAHDFNNLLTVILTHAEFLEESLPRGSQGHEDVAQIVEASERAATVTRQLLAFSRKQQSKPEDLDLNELASNMTRMLRRLIGENIHFSHELEPNLPAVRADPSQLEQVLMNLVVNARDAMPRGGSIKVQTRGGRAEDLAEGDMTLDPLECVALVVSDSGCGMDEQTQARVFEPFFTTKEVGKGTGMGLAMVYGVVKQSSGHVVVHSSAGEGSTFIVLLPATDGSLRARQSRSVPIAAPRGATILLVEDEDNIRRVLARLLRRNGYHVLEAWDGEQALEVVESNIDSLELLVTDVIMPKLGGVDLAARLHETRPELPVLFMSGYTFEMLDEQGLSRDNEHFMQKPFAPAALVAKVHKALAIAGSASHLRALD